MTLRRAGIALLALAGLVLFGVLAGYGTLQRWLDAPLAVGEAPLEIDIPRGQPLAVTARQLAGRGVLEHPRWLQLYARSRPASTRSRRGPRRAACSRCSSRAP